MLSGKVHFDEAMKAQGRRDSEDSSHGVELVIYLKELHKSFVAQGSLHKLVVGNVWDPIICQPQLSVAGRDSSSWFRKVRERA